MKLGMVIYSDDAETVWNAFRLGVYALGNKDNVRAFLLAKGVESESLDTEQFKVSEQMNTFIDKGGEILACGTCLKLRQSEGTDFCPLSTMQDLYELLKESDRVITF
ncbi:DsrE family protein [Kaarinaea lacus]